MHLRIRIGNKLHAFDHGNTRFRRQPLHEGLARRVVLVEFDLHMPWCGGALVTSGPCSQREILLHTIDPHAINV